jgi:O-antigen/teichoic acid export membrane protein
VSTAGASQLLMRLRASRGVRAGMVVAFATVVMNGAGYLYNVACIRYLGSRIYGDVAAVLALIALVSLPLGSLQLLLAREIAQIPEVRDIGHLLRRWTVRACFGGAALVAAGLALISPLQDALSIHSRGALAFGVAGIGFAVLAATFFGVLQGSQRFTALGVTYGAGGISRLLFVVPALLLGFGAVGALAVNLLAGLLSIVIAAWALRDLWPSRAEAAVLPQHDTRQMVTMLVGSLAFASLTNSDILLANYFFDDAQAGVYAAAALVGKAVLFLPAAVVTVLLPKAAERVAAGRTSRNILLASAGVTVVLTLAATGLLALVPESLLVWAFGGEFRDATSLLGWFGLAMTAAALVNVYLSVYFAERDAKFPLLVLGGAIAQVVAISLWHTEPRSIVIVTLGCCSAILVLHELLFPHSLIRAWRGRSGGAPVLSQDVQPPGPF